MKLGLGNLSGLVQARRKLKNFPSKTSTSRRDKKQLRVINPCQPADLEVRVRLEAGEETSACPPRGAECQAGDPAGRREPPNAGVPGVQEAPADAPSPRSEVRRRGPRGGSAHAGPLPRGHRLPVASWKPTLTGSPRGSTPSGKTVKGWQRLVS